MLIIIPPAILPAGHPNVIRWARSLNMWVYVIYVAIL
nr:MAG TPA: hypothetical protein [Caudoviricetes sp.]DAS56977.1 MAG TPA: hypothetical protein [Caudoviricetes sp.]DAZ01691.1 MAG TPA: hypothetical protein [Caudoviricetes sp.]